MRKFSRWVCLTLVLMLVLSGAALAEESSELGVIHKQNYGTNATELPLVKEGDEPVTITVWRDFSSTIMEGLDECLVFQEMEKRTGVKIEWVYPPAGQATDNYNLRIASNDLPHMFSCPPEYSGGLDKAVEDEIYLPINEYYDKGLTPNYKYLRDTYEEIAVDTMLDSGLMVAWHMIDYVPSSPWSGLWVRQDYLEGLGMEVPTTMDEMTEVLRAMKEEYGAVLGCNIKDWYGVATNFNFASGFETGYEWFAKDGTTAVYGPMTQEYKAWLTQMNAWYAEGLLDPDFATRTNADYNAKVANGEYGVFGLAYGEMGQAKVTGLSQNPDFKVLAITSPTSYEGQTLHLRQSDHIVRTDREYLTTRCVEDGIDEIAMQWKDYWYSQEGGDLCSYGVEGQSYQWNENNELEWIYDETGVFEKDDTLDFWTVYPKFKLHNWGYLRDSTAYENQPEVWQCIAEWEKTDDSWVMPPVAHTADEEEELASIMTNVNTYREEMTLKFITGQEPLENFDAYVENMKGMYVEDAVQIKQDALDRYLER